MTLDPETAFGSGEHGSTRVALTLLERWFVPGDRVLDLGSGSGILAIAAVKLGAARAVGIEVDAEANVVAARNASAKRRRVGGRVSRRAMPATLAPLLGPADLVLSNILRTVNTALLPAIAAALAPAGRRDLLRHGGGRGGRSSCRRSRPRDSRCWRSGEIPGGGASPRGANDSGAGWSRAAGQSGSRAGCETVRSTTCGCGGRGRRDWSKCATAKAWWARGGWSRAGKGWQVEVDQRPIACRRPAELTLAVGAGDRERFAWVVEKATELGVTAVIPLETERTAGVASRVRSQHLERLRRHALEAVKQSGARLGPRIEEPLAVGALAGRPLAGEGWLADLSGAAAAGGPGYGAAHGRDRSGGRVHRRGAGALPRAGYLAVSLGPHTLRFETAAVAAAAAAAAARLRRSDG